MAKEAEKPHLSIHPDICAPGDTLTIRIDAPKDAKKVSVTVVELDSHSPLEDAGPSKDIVAFEGSLRDGVFQPAGAPKIRTPDSNAPKLLIEIAGGAAPVEVPLPDAKLENGVFELGVTLRTEAGVYTVPSATAGPDPVLVRMFTHYKANNVPRPVIAFITGTDEGFFDAATAYWRLNADAVLVRKGMSLSEVLTSLDALAPQLGPLGQVNIVAHGNPEHLKMKLFPDDPRAFLHEDLLTRNSGNLKIPAAVDEQTEVYFRSCNAGLNQELLDVLKTTCFPAARFVKIPKWPQGYEFKTENKRDASGKPSKQVVTVATEFFLEQLHFERPTPAEAKRDAAIEFPKSFDRIKTRSPGLSATASYADEEASYRERSPLAFSYADRMFYREADISDPAGKRLADDAIVARYREDWYDREQGSNEDKSETGRTRDDRWFIKLAGKPVEAKSLPPNSGGDIETMRGVAFQSDQGDPGFQQLDGGALTLGTKTPSTWLIKAAGVDDLHLDVTMAPDGDLNDVLLEHRSTSAGKVSDVSAGGKTVRLDAANPSLTATLPLTLTLGELATGAQNTLTGTAQVTIRRGKVFDVGFDASRVLVARRRKMMQFENMPYEQRKVVVQPNADNDEQLFGKA